MSMEPEQQQREQVGYCRPPIATQFKKGKSGNPKGRPRNRRRDIPYDTLLGQMVTVREDGRERRVTAAEAFILQLTKKGLEGDSASARASLTAIETARAHAARRTRSASSVSASGRSDCVVQSRTSGWGSFCTPPTRCECG